MKNAFRMFKNKIAIVHCIKQVLQWDGQQLKSKHKNYKMLIYFLCQAHYFACQAYKFTFKA